MPARNPKYQCPKCGGVTSRRAAMCRPCYDKAPRSEGYLDCKSEGCTNHVSLLSRSGYCRKCYTRIYNYGEHRKPDAEGGYTAAEGVHWELPIGKPFKNVPNYQTDTVEKGRKHGTL